MPSEVLSDAPDHRDEQTAPLLTARISGRLQPQQRLYTAAALSGALGIWFAYDGWLSTAPEMEDHRTFNQLWSVVLAAFAILALIASVGVSRAGRELRSSAYAHFYLSPGGDEIRVATVPWLWSLMFAGLNLIPHKSPLVGFTCFFGARAFPFLPLALAFFAGRIIRAAYESEGWRRL